MSKMAVLAAASLALAGCANQILSDDHIRRDTALALNVAPEALVISGRQYDGFATTYYTASTHAVVGKRARVVGISFRCKIEGGNINTMGLTNPPVCARL